MSCVVVAPNLNLDLLQSLSRVRHAPSRTFRFVTRDRRGMQGMTSSHLLLVEDRIVDEA
jgi:hypothetical protein